jgi:taurine transport system substrate-binding protein
MRLTGTFAAALAALALVVAGCGASEGGGDKASSDSGKESGGKPAKLRVAYQVIPNGDPIVKHERWLEETLGIPVEWQQFDSGADVNRAVASGSVDVGLAGSSPVANGIASGLPYKVAWIYDVIGDNEQLVARSSEGISDVKGLKGRKVAAPFGSTTHYSLLTAVTKAGLKPADLDIIDLQPEDIVAAWQRGDIDGAYVWNPSLAKLKDDGGKVLVSSAELAEQGTVTGDLGIVSNDFAEKYPDVVQQWVNQENRAVQLYRDDPGAAAAAVAEEFEISRAEARRQMKDLIWLDASQQASAEYLGKPGAPGALSKQLETTAKFLKGQKLIDRDPSSAEFKKAVDGQWVAKAGGG